LLSSEGVPFKYNSSLSHPEAVKIAGLIYDLILFSKRTLDDLKRSGSGGNITLRMRLKSGEEFIVVQGKKIYTKN
jgi:hypothetical protein